ncbi:glycosyltransferase [Paenibacillus puldeungensis]|uniref:Glycosyltransferase n=1 Tax=Paenibacillus puldeungensis TaxID=696536 RepID=A0ABW3RT06_9BACL
MKILFLITGFDYAGAESQVVLLCRDLRARNCEIRLVTMIPPVAYLDELREMGVEVQSLGMQKGVPDPRAIFRLARIIREMRPDVVHSHLVHANLLARVTRLFVKIPFLICTAHSINEGGRVREWLYRLSDPLGDLLTNVSREAVDRYISLKIAPARKIKLITNGVNLEQFGGGGDRRSKIRDRLDLAAGPGREAEPFMWLAAGRFVPEKDYPVMIHAFAEVLRKYPNSRLFIAGIGPELPLIERRTVELEIQEKVHFLGIRTDISELMSAADGFVLSSKWEGLPIVLLEASASRLPIIATRVGGNEEVVLDGVNGYVTEPENHHALARSMERLMVLTSEERLSMGEHGREHVMEHYEIGRVAQKWADIYGQACGRELPAALLRNGVQEG